MTGHMTSSAFAVMPFKFGLYWWHYNAVPFSPLTSVPKNVLVEKNLVTVFVPPFYSFSSKTQYSRKKTVQYCSKGGGGHTKPAPSLTSLNSLKSVVVK